jgi:hypothetical protein
LRESVVEGGDAILFARVGGIKELLLCRQRGLETLLRVVR